MRLSKRMSGLANQGYGTIVRAFVLTGIVVNLYDYVVHDVLLLRLLYSRLPIMRYGGAGSQLELVTDSAVPWFVLLDFAAAAIFVVAYYRLRNVLPAGLRGGVVFGVAAGVLINVPTWIICSLQLNGFPLALAGAWTFAGVGWSLIAGVATAAAMRNSRIRQAASSLR
jgi:hypothetical protein